MKQETYNPSRFPTVFPVNTALFASFASHGPDHLCIIFYAVGSGKRVGSYCAEHLGVNRQDYFSEVTGESEICSSLEAAINKATQECGR